MSLPSLPLLTGRLAACPPAFLEEPRWEGAGSLRVAALVYDTLDFMGEPPARPEGGSDLEMIDPLGEVAALSPFERRAGTESNEAALERLRLTALACWLLNDSFFRDRRELAPRAAEFLRKGWGDLPSVLTARDAVGVPERREELARRLLKALGLRPDGETPAQAEDRLGALDSVELRRVMEAARQAQERTQKVLKAIRKKAADEAAAQYGRE